MNRTEKVNVIGELNEAFLEAPHVVLTRFSGLSANQANDLRRRIERAGGRYMVLKNRLAKRAAAGTSVERLMDRFTGPCGLAAHATDPVVLAKTITEFTKDNPQLELLAGIVDAREVIDARAVKTLATLPGLPEIRAQLLAMIQTPGTTLVRLLATPGGQLARALDARREKLEGAA
jgi:large subunit ribosomal protein L10